MCVGVCGVGYGQREAHSIGIGEVPGISQPATEMVVRASPESEGGRGGGRQRERKR